MAEKAAPAADAPAETEASQAKPTKLNTGPRMDRGGIMAFVERGCLKADVPRFEIGDTVDVHVRIPEEKTAPSKKKKPAEEKKEERIQIFNGVVIARSGSGAREMFVVRRIVAGEGVERKFPLHAPIIKKIDVKRSAVVRRAKLYFLRDRVGKAVRLRERRG